MSLKLKVKNMKKYLSILLFVSMFTVCAKAQFGTPDADAKYATELLKPGTEAPDFKLKTVDGKTFRLSSLRGQYVVLDFWASWCPDCRKDAPNLVRMHQQFKDKGVAFVGVSFDYDKEAWRKGIETYHIDYTQVSELKRWKETAISPAYHIKWIPSMYLVDPEGRIVLGTVLSDKLERTLYERTATAIERRVEPISIDGAKGRLAALLQKPLLADGQSCPLAILCHGFGGNKEAQLLQLIADTLQQHGIASIRFDFNGHGQSEGLFEEMTVPNEIEDLKKVVAYARDLRFVSRLALVGHSQGGVVSAMTAGELEPGDISAVALLAPAAVLRDDAIRGNTFGKTYDPLDPPESVALFGNQKLGRNYIKTAFTLPIYETAARYQGPAIIVHGTGDRIVPYTYGERFHAAWPGSTYVQLDAFDHGFAQNPYRASLLVSQFLIDKLK